MLFRSGTGIIRGATSGANATITVASDTATMDNAFEDVVDNHRLKTEGDGIIDFSETNPFGEP